MEGGKKKQEKKKERKEKEKENQHTRAENKTFTRQLPKIIFEKGETHTMDS